MPHSPPPTHNVTSARDPRSRPGAGAAASPSARRRRKKRGDYLRRIGEGHARCRFRPHPAAERDRRLRARLRDLVRRHARAQQGRRLARLVRGPDHPSCPPDRRNFREPGQKTVWADGLDVPLAASFAPATTAVPVDGGYRVSGNGSPFASGVDHCLLGHARRHGAGRRRTGMEVLSGRRPATTPCATPGSPPACGRPAARPSSSTMCSCRRAGCCG